MKKILFIIIFISVATIVFCVIYIPNMSDRNTSLYRSLVTYENIIYKYAADEPLTLDIFMPTEDVYEHVPVVFYVHGGLFIDGDKMDLTRDIGEEVTYAILDAGYAIVSMNYRILDEETHFPSNIKDIKDSIRFIRSVSNDYGLDALNFGIWGTGSGAYLAMTVAYSSSGMFLGDYELRSFSAEVNYAIDFYGITSMNETRDIEAMSASELEEVQEGFDILYGPIYDVYNLTAQDYMAMSDFDPLSYVSDDTIPTLIIHGRNDETIPISQSNLLIEKLEEYELDYSFYSIVGGNFGLTEIRDSEKENICNYVRIFLSQNYVSRT